MPVYKTFKLHVKLSSEALPEHLYRQNNGGPFPRDNKHKNFPQNLREDKYILNTFIGKILSSILFLFGFGFRKCHSNSRHGISV